MQFTRREAIVKLAFLMGTTAVGPRLLAGDFGKVGGPHWDFSPEDIVLLDEIGDTIIPATDLPGAKAVGIGAFMAMMVTDCYYLPEQTAFKTGLKQIAQDYRTKYGESFVGSATEKRITFLNALDLEQRQQRGTSRAAQNINTPQASESGLNEASRMAVPHYFRMMKELTLLGYFTSEPAQSQIFGYLEVPGRYDGDVPYKKRPAKH